MGNELWYMVGDNDTIHRREVCSIIFLQRKDNEV